jgi:hypothetical protein
VNREQVIALIGGHAKKLAEVAREQGCATLSYMLEVAAEQAERQLETSRGDGENTAK